MTSMAKAVTYYYHSVGVGVGVYQGRARDLPRITGEKMMPKGWGFGAVQYRDMTMSWLFQCEVCWGLATGVDNWAAGIC